MSCAGSGLRRAVVDGFDFGEPYTINEVVGDNPADCHYDRSLSLVELEKR